MEKKHSFDSVVEVYDKRRPNYGSKIFEDIIEYADITEEKSLLEIGCGTGQATEPFMKTNCSITAAEIGENLASYTEKKFKDYEKLKVITTPFEEYPVEEKFHMVYSATAFHWIPDEIGYKKVHEHLHPNGTIALFWNRPSVDIPKNELNDKIQSVYKKYVPEWSLKIRTEEQVKELYQGIKNKIIDAGFKDVELRIYKNKRVMTGKEYIELLGTYSDHILLEEEKRNNLYRGIRKAIEEAGDEMVINDTVDLYLGRK